MSLNDAVANFDTNGDNSDETKPDETLNPSANPASDGTDHPEFETPETETKTVQVQAQVPVDEDDTKVETETVDKDFVFAQTLDPRRSIPGTSQYLDQVERRNAELLRAKAEDREPDLDNPPAYQGTPLYTKAQATQQGLDITGEAVETVTLPVVQEVVADEDRAKVNYDAYNGYAGSGSDLVNSGVPR